MFRMTTILAAALGLASPAIAWQAGQEGAVCTLSHQEPEGVAVLLTYDPAGPIYTITISRPEPWPDAPAFGIAFLGGEELTITTNRQTLSEDGMSLSVADRGFGNVLAGLSRNAIARMFAGEADVAVSLEGAAPEVAAFEACSIAPTA